MQIQINDEFMERKRARENLIEKACQNGKMAVVDEVSWLCWLLSDEFGVLDVCVAEAWDVAKQTNSQIAMQKMRKICPQQW